MLHDYQHDIGVNNWRPPSKLQHPAALQKQISIQVVTITWRVVGIAAVVLSIYVNDTRNKNMKKNNNNQRTLFEKTLFDAPSKDRNHFYNYSSNNMMDLNNNDKKIYLKKKYSQ